MALLRSKDVQKMSAQEKKEKLGELKMELVKERVSANKTNAKTKEIKRAIARLLTSKTVKNAEMTDIKINKSAKEALKNK